MPPRWTHRIRRMLATVFWRMRDEDMEREMAFHVEQLARDYERGGMNPAAARAAARTRFGDSTRHKERGHDIRGSALTDGVWRDLRHTARGLMKAPGFALGVVLTLAIGIGANTAIFSVVDQLLLRPLPYPDGDRLLTIHETFQDLEAIDFNSVSPANWLDWQRESRTLGALAIWGTTSYTLTGLGPPARVNAQTVSAEFFPLLGVAPALGRVINGDDDRPGQPQVAVLSHECWQQRFGSDPRVVGRVVQLSDTPFQIIGVMPPGFRLIRHDTDVWTAMRLDRAARWRENAGRFLNVVARLQSGATLAEARAELETIAARLSATYDFNRRTGVRLTPLRESLTARVAGSLMTLYAAVGVLLTIACVNVANLLMARSASRRRELAIRGALGAGRGAIVQQQLVESLLLALSGGLLGVLLSHFALEALVALAPPDLLKVPELTVDPRVLAYALSISVLTGLAAGVVPAIFAAGQPLVAGLRAGGRGVAQSPQVRQALVVCQVALTVVLLCGAGLLVQTMLTLGNADSGVAARGLLTMDVALPAARYDGDRRVVYFQNAVAALRALPGVTNAAAAYSLPVIGNRRGGTAFHILGTPELPLSEAPGATIRVVTPGYFATTGTPVLRGREFLPSDDTTPEPGFVVNDAFVREFLGGDDPLTASLKVWMRRDNPYMPIVGVVGDVSEGSLREKAEPTIFYSHRVLNETTMTLLVRAERAEALARAAEAAVQAIDPNIALTRVRTFESALRESLARERLTAMLTGTFAASALLLSALGLYALLAFLITERTKELGIRIALGAGLARVTGSVVAGGLRLVLCGAVVGVLGSLVLLRSLGTLLYGVTPHDPATYAGGLVLLFAVSALASYVPARRAARVQPLEALRQD